MRIADSAATWLLAAAALVEIAPAASAQAAYDLGASKHLKILYAGVPETSRARVFMEFLKANFDTADLVDVEKLTKESAAPYDVVVCDGHRIYPMDPQKPAINSPKCTLGDDFTRPIVMIASMAGTVQHHTKIGWL